VRSAFLILVAIGCSSCHSAKRQPGAQGTGDPPPPVIHREPIPDESVDDSQDAPGKLPMSTVEQHMGVVREAIKACADATTYEGKVSARIIISPAGEASATITQGSGQANIDECVVRAFADAKFPSSQRGQRLVYSYTF
jgi:hypothetical protein